MLLSPAKAKNVRFLMRTMEVSCPLNSSKKHVVPHLALTAEEVGNYTIEAITIVEYESTWCQLGKNLLFQWEPNLEFYCRAKFKQQEVLHSFHYCLRDVLCWD